jgi:hypothetical protein
MTPKTKLAIRRVAIRWTRKLLDFLYESLDGRLHAEEVRLRDAIEIKRANVSRQGQLGANGVPVHLPVEPASPARAQGHSLPGGVQGYDEFLHDRVQRRASLGGEPQRAAQTKTRRRACTATAFDLRFSSQ